MEYKVTVTNFKTGKVLYEAKHEDIAFTFSTTSNQETGYKKPIFEMVQCHPSFDFDHIHYTCWVTLPEPYIDIEVTLDGHMLFIAPKKTTLTKKEIEATMQPIVLSEVK